MTSNGVLEFEHNNVGHLSPQDLKRKAVQKHDSSSTESFQKIVPRNIPGSDKDVVRLIGQYLSNLGLSQTVDVLVKESATSLEHPAVVRFRNFVYAGDWDRAEASLTDLQPLVSSYANMKAMRFLLLQQKFVELVENGWVLRALECLRIELRPLAPDSARLQQLSSLLCAERSDAHSSLNIFPPDDSYRMVGASATTGFSAVVVPAHTSSSTEPIFSGATSLQTSISESVGGDERSGSTLTPYSPLPSRRALLDKLQVYLPASVMLPPQRLRTMLEQALQLQATRCAYHNTAIPLSLENTSLLNDHACSRETFPSSCRQVLNDHVDEVWMCRFSPDGSLLATGCKDGTVLIWSVSPDPFHVKLLRSLECQHCGVGCLAWSPDSKSLLTCGRESNEVLVWNVSLGEVVARASGTADDLLTVAAWHQNGSGHFSCAGMRGHLYHCQEDGVTRHAVEGIRVHALCCTDSAALAADSHYRIHAYNVDTSSAHVFQEDRIVNSFSLDESMRFALLNIQGQGLHMWDLADKCLVRRFQGLSQPTYVIHSCFGGANQDFIASGSENHKVYLWHRSREEPLITLSGHTRSVNCVHWNPQHPHMLASASDDGTVRIWGPATSSSVDDDVVVEEARLDESNGPLSVPDAVDLSACSSASSSSMTSSNCI